MGLLPHHPFGKRGLAPLLPQGEGTLDNVREFFAGVPVFGQQGLGWNRNMAHDYLGAFNARELAGHQIS